MSAATDVETGAEITDETELKHGAFTKALLTTYKENPSDLTMSELLKKINALIEAQDYGQTPTYHYDPERLNKNLIGINSAGFSNNVSAVCVAAKNGVVIINKGLLQGISRGNILRDVNAGNKKLQITKAFTDSAIAIDKNRFVKEGDTLQVEDNYTASNALVKIFIPTITCTNAGFQTFFNAHIKPYADQNNYGDFNVRNESGAKKVMLYYDGKIVHDLYLPRTIGEDTMVYNFILPPLPSYLVNLLKIALNKNQNIQIVNKIDEADYVLYCNYKKERPDHAAGFAFYFHPPMEDRSKYNDAIFTFEAMEFPSINVTGKELQAMAQKIYDLATRTMRYKTLDWINTYPRRH